MNTNAKTRALLGKKYDNLLQSPYTIQPYTIKQAKRLGVEVKPSTKKDKKLDVFDKKGDYITSVGAIGYSDFPTYFYLEKRGVYPEGHARKRRLLYKKRHNLNRHIIGTASYYADQLLW